MKAKLVIDEQLEIDLGGDGLQAIMDSLMNYYPLDVFSSDLKDRIETYLRGSGLRGDTRELLDVVAPYRKLESKINTTMAGVHHYIKVDGKLMNTKDFIKWNNSLPKDKQFNMNGAD